LMTVSQRIFVLGAKRLGKFSLIFGFGGWG
jgi:hypothetical protein